MKGTVQPNGNVLAMQVEANKGDQGREADVKGAIGGLSGGCPTVTFSRAVSTDIVDFLARVVVSVTKRPHPPSGVERRKRMADDRALDDDVSFAATL